VFEKLVEKRIQAAQQRGDFDALPGAGKPLPADESEWVPDEFRLAYRVLKNAGCSPPQLGVRKELTNLNMLLAGATDAHEARRIGRRMSLLAASLGLRPDTTYYAALSERLRDK
jgi:hypothetical protein